jgi:microcompartment protein CcmL/EutN
LQSIVSAVESLAQSHSILAQNIEADIERPLRDYQTKNKEMRAMSTIQGNLASIAKDLEAAQKRAEKVKGGKSSTKIANASSDVDMATQQWESQAPYVFEQLQALDENRVNHLRDVLTQLETHEVDQVERNRITAESCLNALLNLNTSEEISVFVAKTSAGRPPPTPRQKSRTTAGDALRPPTPTRGHDDGASEMSTTSAGAVRPVSSPCMSRCFRSETVNNSINSSRTTVWAQAIRYHHEPVASKSQAS